MNNWRIISTAPRDGTAILIWPYVPSYVHGEEVTIGFFDPYVNSFVSEHNSRYPIEPTHWQPLPEPPTGK